MYGIEDFNLNDFDLIEIKKIEDNGHEDETFDIEVEDKHYFYIKNPENNKEECIVSHNTAEIMFGDPSDIEFLDLKDPSKNKAALTSHRWACVSGNTKIHTSIGNIDIDKLLKNDVWKNTSAIVDGTPYKILGVKNTGRKQTYTIATKGGQSITTSKTHMIKTIDGWKKTSELRIGEKIVISDNNNIETNIKSKEYEKGYLTGHLIGDGTFTVNTTTKTDIARLQIYEQDTGWYGMKKYIEKIFPFKGRKDFKATFIGPNISKNTGVLWYFLSCKEFTDYLKSLGVIKGNKHITDTIETQSNDFISGLLSGLFDADGWISNDRNPVLHIEQSHKEDIYAIQRILLRLGIKNRIMKLKTKDGVINGNKIKRKQAYRLTLCGVNETKRFMKLCDLHHIDKKIKWNKAIKTQSKPKNKKCYVIENIIKNKIEHTYDMSVDKIHAYSANGFYVHNSNNSIFAEIGMDYGPVAERTAKNGEPGYFWLDNARAYSRMSKPIDNKDFRVAGANPCVTPDTKILTSIGYEEIGKIVNKKVDVWNGEEWSNVLVKKTGENQDILKVSLSDGTELKCTPYHQWILVGNERIEAQDLQIGDSLEKFTMPIVKDFPEQKNFLHPYTHGFYCGDGQYNKNSESKGSLLYGEKKLLAPYLDGQTSGKQLNGDRIWFGMPKDMKDKFVVPIYSSIVDKLKWFSGLLDADGTVVYNPNSCALQLGNINKEFLQDTRLMLTTLGVQAKIIKSQDEQYKLLPDGNGGEKEYLCKDFYRLQINAIDTSKLVTLGLHTRRLKINKITPNRDARRFVTVSSIEYLGVEPEVFCFTEQKANRGTFNGIVTGQCNEQSLESWELCCLVETYPSMHETLEEWHETLKYAYLYAKTVTLVSTHHRLTNAVMMRNRRIGCSISGITQAFTKFGRRKFFQACDIGYDKIQKWDKQYADWLGIPRSIKTTSIKPSGCFIPETKVKTTDGVKTLTEIFSENDIDLGEKGEEYREWYDTKKDIFVYDEHNNKQKITKLFVNGYDKTLKLEFDDGTKIECTPNHKFKLKNGIWKEAKDLNNDDEIETFK